MQKGDDALSGVILAGRGILVKMLVLYMYFDQYFHTYPCHWFYIIILNLEK